MTRTTLDTLRTRAGHCALTVETQAHGDGTLYTFHAINHGGHIRFQAHGMKNAENMLQAYSEGWHDGQAFEKQVRVDIDAATRREEPCYGF